VSERTPVRPFELDPSRIDPARIELVEEKEHPENLPAPLEPPPQPAGRPWLRLFVGAGITTLLGLLGLEAWWHLEALYDRSIALGATFATLYGLTAAGGLGLAFREWWSLRRLAIADGLRERARQLTGSGVHGQAEPLLTRIEGLYRGRPDLRPHLARFRERVSDAHDDGERLRLFSETVLAPLDREAYQLVKKGGRDIGALTALSPIGLLDGLIVLVRTMMMLRAIARLYGVRPGAVASLSLVRKSARNMIAAGIGDLVSDAAVETAGATVLSVLSARAGQGVVNGLLAARLGLSAMQLCRPLPFTAEETPTMGQLRAELFERKA
jgi:putative membrane protein